MTQGTFFLRNSSWEFCDWKTQTVSSHRCEEFGGNCERGRDSLGNLVVPCTNIGKVYNLLHLLLAQFINSDALKKKKLFDLDPLQFLYSSYFKFPVSIYNTYLKGEYPI